MQDQYAHKVTIITAESHDFSNEIKQLVEYKDLIFLLIRRDFVSVYKQSVLGPIWFILTPIISTVLYTIIFGNFIKIPTDDNLPHFIFYLTGIIVWNLFAFNLTKTAGTFSNNAHIMGKVYFPRLVVPIATILSNYIAIGIQFIVLLVVLFIFSTTGFELRLDLNVLLIPVILITIPLWASSFGLLIAALSVKYKDLIHALSFIVQVGMYASPVIYPISAIPGALKPFAYINPLSALIEGFRTAITGFGTINYQALLLSVVCAVAASLISIYIYLKQSKRFIDTI